MSEDCLSQANLSLTLVLVVALTTLLPGMSHVQGQEETPPLRSVSLQVDKNKIYLPTGTIDITKEPKLTRPPPHLEEEPYAYYIAHFRQAPTRAMASGDFVTPLFFNTYIMRMTPARYSNCFPVPALSELGSQSIDASAKGSIEVATWI